MCEFIYLWETLEEHTKMQAVKPSHIGVHKTHAHPSNIYQLPEFISRVMSRGHLHLVLQHTFQFQMALLPSLHNNSHTATLLMPTSPRNLWVSFKVKCHVHYSTNEFNYLTCTIVLLFLLGSYPFECHWQCFWVCGFIYPQPCCVHCMVLHMNFRNAWTAL